MTHPLANTSHKRARKISEWLKRDMIETGNTRYLDFLTRQSSHVTWSMQVNSDVVAFAMIRSGNCVETLDFMPGVTENWNRWAVETMIGEFVKYDFTGIKVENPSEESRALFEAAGFTDFVAGYSDAPVLGLRIEQEFDLTKIKGDSVPYAIRFYDKGFREGDGTEPYAAFTGVGVLTDLKELHLARRASMFADLPTISDEATVEIVVDGELVIRDVIRKNVFKSIGARKDPAHGVYFDSLDLFTHRHLDFHNASSWLYDD